ncbi:MMPL family transporter [Nocardia pseudovaccinii]|uniref:MMPL family transporter n=1 Tax=Nocardia pseudovaccinii TaxID=189540 RepID=UPI003D8C991D
MMTRLALLARRYPRRIVGVTLLLTILAGVYGAAATWKLPAGGQDVPSSESVRADQILDEKFNAGGGMSVVLTVTSPNGVDDAAAVTRGKQVEAALRESPYIRQVVSYWSAPSQLSGPLVSNDRHTGLVAARIVGDDSTAPMRAHDLTKPFVGTHDGVTVNAGGLAMGYYTGTVTSRQDLLVLEAIAIPVTVPVLVWVFGSLIASLLPLMVALFAVAGTTALLWSIHSATYVSIFSLNIATALGLAMAVDYTLFILNRYREEIASGSAPDRALTVTMNTAGRTVSYSGMTMALTMAVLVLFPAPLLKSLGYGGVAAVVLSQLAALIVGPALIVLLGDRLNAFDVRKPVLGLLGRVVGRPRAPEEQFWYKVAKFSMRRAIPVILVVGAVLLALGTPFLGVSLGFPDDRNADTSTTVRRAGDILREQFPQQNPVGEILIVLPSGVTSPKEVSAYAAELSKVPDVTTVAGPNGMYVAGRPVSAATFDAALKGDAAYLSVSTVRDPFADSGKEQLAAVKRVPPPAPALYTGQAQHDIDNVAGVKDRVPLITAIIALITLVLMFLMTGSVLLPIKALIMNVLSMTAAFGAIVWLYQDGHLGGLGTSSTAHHTIAFILPLMACIVYALSMDYEVFVLSRVREEWLRSDRTVAANVRSVALGMAHTGRIVTAAAVIMVIVFLAIATAQIAFMRALGTGLTIAVLVDAFLVRVLLVPAFMKLAGRLNWWAPGPVARWHERWGLTETSTFTPSEPAVAAAPAAHIEDAPLVHDR